MYLDWIHRNIGKRLKRAVNFFLIEIHPVFAISALFLLTFFWASYLPSLTFNYNIERFFSSQDSEVAFYNDHREVFGNENDVVLIGIKNNEGLFKMDFLDKVDVLSEGLKNIIGVKKVYSPTTLYETVKGPIGAIRVPVIHLNNSDKLRSDKKRIYSSGIYTNSFFSSDTLSISILLKKDGSLSKKGNDSLLLSINNAVSEFQFDEYHLAGRIKTQNYYVKHMKNQMGLFGSLAFLLFLISLFFIFKKLPYVAMSLIAILISLVWIFGIIAWMGVQLDLMLTLIPTLIFIIGTSGSIHLISRFRKEYTSRDEKPIALNKAIFETGLPNFLNAITTAVGFASLVVIPVIPLQRFGLFTALGILLSFFIGLIVVTTGLRLINITPDKIVVRKKSAQRSVYKNIYDRPGLLISAFSIFIIACVYFSFQVKVNNHFLDDLNPSSSLKTDLDFFENNFSGIRPFEINIQSADESDIMGYESLKELELVETYLVEEYKVGFILSPLSMIKSLNKTMHGGSRDYYKIPDTEQEYNKVLKMADKRHIWRKTRSILSEDKTIGRISGRTKDEGSILINGRNEKLISFLQANSKKLKFQLTGSAHLMDNANSHIAWNLTVGIMLAIIIATLIIGLFTWSWKLALISMIPNIMPLLFVSGIMGLSGIALKVSTSLIFTIAYGIAVDDTIHFLNAYRLNKKLFTDANRAILESVSKMWRPMTYTTLVLFAGFMIFIFSEFSSISMLGYLIGAALMLALVSDLLFLPLHLKLITKRR